jgi:hypothetical protein
MIKMRRKIYASIVFDDQKFADHITEFDVAHPIRLHDGNSMQSFSEEECLNVIGALTWGLQAIRKREDIET